jgi:hypothetical protein
MEKVREISEKEFNEQMLETKNFVTEDFLKKGLMPKKLDITKIECEKHEIDVCVVSYMSEDVIMANPVHWCKASYYISEKFVKNGISFKIFTGMC